MIFVSVKCNHKLFLCCCVDVLDCFGPTFYEHSLLDSSRTHLSYGGTVLFHEVRGGCLGWH